ncbi:hypothetical protein Anas_03229 [Armadillidium nasatum]|uniref:Uncharacterized protein n=1 Tax=Armadillidium nasatum TaxID=96803 RepID=A0A5N5T0B4_9CRUS|nr:hypothetical protein Anas_03229 [Armadillidium nasatum]
MGQCTSGELPPAIQIDNKNGNVPTNELPSDASESPDPSLSSKKSRRSSRSVAASWVANKLSKRSKNSQVSAAFNLLDHDVKVRNVHLYTLNDCYNKF